MLKLSKKVEYALMALVHMDTVRGRRLEASRDIAETYHIPSELLGKVLQKLAKSGLAESVPGFKGGYRLKKRLEDMTLGDVMVAVEGPVRLTNCQGERVNCEQFPHCNIRDPIFRIQDGLTDHVHGIKLSEFRTGEADRNSVVVNTGKS